MLNRIGQVFLSAVLLAGAAMGTAQAADKAINFGIMSTESSQNLKSVWQPFLDDMQKKTGLTINATFASDYAGLIQGMRFNKVDVAWLEACAALRAISWAAARCYLQALEQDCPSGPVHLVGHSCGS